MLESVDLEKVESFLFGKLQELNELGVINFLKSKGAVASGHFVGTKGGHMDTYINIKKATEDIDNLTPLAMSLAYDIKDVPADILLAAPYGAQDLVPLVAMFYRSFTGRPVQVLKLVKKRRKGETEEDIVWYKDHADKVIGKKVILIDDVINTGGSLEDGRDLIEEALGKMVACGVVCNRQEFFETQMLADKLRAAIYSLCIIEVENYTIDLDKNLKTQCPLCREGVPINQQIGHGKEFLDNYGQRFPNMIDWAKKMRG
jgi:orotate phosphoribosyltransferase